MNKAELIAAVANETGLSKTQAASALDAVGTALTKALKAGDKVAWSGIGTFEVGARAARTGRNPQTGAAIQIAASKNVKFKAAKAIKDSLNG